MSCRGYIAVIFIEVRDEEHNSSSNVAYFHIILTLLLDVKTIFTNFTRQPDQILTSRLFYVFTTSPKQHFLLPNALSSLTFPSFRMMGYCKGLKSFVRDVG